MALKTVYDELTENPVFTAPEVGGDEAPNPNGRTGLIVVNDGAERTLTVDSNRESNFGPYPDKTFTIAAGSIRTIPELDPRRFNNLDGRITFTFDAITDVTIALIERGTIYKD